MCLRSWQSDRSTMYKCSWRGVLQSGKQETLALQSFTRITNFYNWGGLCLFEAQKPKFVCFCSLRASCGWENTTDLTNIPPPPPLLLHVGYLIITLRWCSYKLVLYHIRFFFTSLQKIFLKYLICRLKHLVESYCQMAVTNFNQNSLQSLLRRIAVTRCTWWLPGVIHREIRLLKSSGMYEQNKESSRLCACKRFDSVF